MTIEMITLAIAFLLLIVTCIYAFFTYKILKANEGVLREMQQQQESLYRPYISISPVTFADNPILSLRIKNTGRTNARQVKLVLDRDFYQFGEMKEENNLRNFSAFSTIIDSFAPDAEMLFYLAQSFVIFGENANPEITPSVFKVTAKYEYYGGTVEETTTIDLKPYLHSAIPQNPIAVELKKIKESIDKMCRSTDSTK